MSSRALDRVREIMTVVMTLSLSVSLGLAILVLAFQILIPRIPPVEGSMRVGGDGGQVIRFTLGHH